MQSGQSKLQKARFYSSVGILYVATLLFALYVFRPFGMFSRQKVLAYTPVIGESSITDSVSSPKAITGKPVRLVVGSLSIDLPVDEGFYNEADQTWTLSAKHAQYASPTMPANNIRGNTLIYGHYNVYVFLRLKQIQPGSVADVYTDNGHIFTYEFKRVEQLKPEDVTIFDYQSYPMLTLQTCTGSFYEFRQMFYFTLQKVDGQNV